jgi:CheY-like chemotaxis protein
MATVLVVDDSPVDRRLAQGLLERGGGLKVLSAANGAIAFELVHQQQPDIIVTDLQMPEIDGLELVGLVRGSFPLIPVILMTAHGSEEVAVQALQRGAASYVPKSRLGEDLQSTVYSVLALARADRYHDRLLHCLSQSSLRFELDNDPALIFPLVDHMQQQISRLKLVDDTGRIRVGIALEEALLNALYHGNLELSARDLAAVRSAAGLGPSLIDERIGSAPYQSRKIVVEAEFSASQAKFVITDEGCGFDPTLLPDAEAPQLEEENGRGLLLMRTFMDEVEFNARGNQVTMIKRRDHAS